MFVESKGNQLLFQRSLIYCEVFPGRLYLLPGNDNKIYKDQPTGIAGMPRQPGGAGLYNYEKEKVAVRKFVYISKHTEREAPVRCRPFTLNNYHY